MATIDKPFESGNKALIYLVASPIGNLSDVSKRAVEILSAADIIACEDTRVTSSLLKSLGIQPKRLVSCYAQKEQEEGLKLVKEVKEKGLMMAFLSDAGTPGISDPGALVVQAAIAEGVSVSSIPGPAAFVSALIASGFDTADFSFYGFLPAKASARNKMLESLKEREETLIFYEAPHRIIETLTALEQSFGAERRVCLARELTKIHEEYTRASLGELTADFNQIMLKGEFVIVVEGLKKSEQKKEMSSEEILKEAQKMIQGGKRKTEIAKTISDEIGTNKDYVYKLIKDL